MTKAILNINHLHFTLNSRISTESKRVVLHMCFFTCIIVIIFLCQIGFIYESYDARLKNYQFFHLEMDLETRTMIFKVYTITMVFTYTNNIITVTYISMLCSSVYASLGNIIHLYRKSINKSLTTERLDARIILKSITTFRQVVIVVKNTDCAFSKSSLFLFGTYISCFFHMLSLIVMAENTYKVTTSTIITLTAFIIALVQFLNLVGTASSINKEDEILKKSVIFCLEKALASVKPVGDSSTKLQLVSLLCDSIRGTPLFVSGGEMFEIKKGIILTTVGAIITYGVLLLQFSHYF